MGKKKKQEEKHTKVKIESISLEMYDYNKKISTYNLKGQ